MNARRTQLQFSREFIVHAWVHLNIECMQTIAGFPTGFPEGVIYVRSNCKLPSLSVVEESSSGTEFPEIFPSTIRQNFLLVCCFLSNVWLNDLRSQREHKLLIKILIIEKLFLLLIFIKLSLCYTTNISLKFNNYINILHSKSDVYLP